MHMTARPTAMTDWLMRPLHRTSDEAKLTRNGNASIFAPVILGKCSGLYVAHSGTTEEVFELLVVERGGNDGRVIDGSGCTSGTTPSRDVDEY
jgi:hypothetical protein